MQSCSRRCHRSTLVSINRLISLAISNAIFPGDIWRQGDVTESFQCPEEIRNRLEPDQTLAKASPSHDLSDQIVIFSKIQPLPDPDLASGADQGLPFIRFAGNLPGKQYLNPAFQ